MVVRVVVGRCAKDREGKNAETNGCRRLIVIMAFFTTDAERGAAAIGDPDAVAVISPGIVVVTGVAGVLVQQVDAP
jgi:hypothetical protein